MAHITADRVKESTTTTGTGALTLSGALTGFRAFSAVCATSDTVHYALQAVDGSGVPTGEWEVGIGTYSGANTLTRTTVLSSSNAGAAVSLAAGTKHVWIDLPAVRSQIGHYSGVGYPTISANVGDLYRATDGFPGQALFWYVGAYSGLPVVVNWGILAPTATASPITVSMRRPVKAGNLLYAVAFNASVTAMGPATGWTGDISNNTPSPAINSAYKVVASDGESVRPFNVTSGESLTTIHVFEIANANTAPVAYSISKYNAVAGRIFTSGNLALLVSVDSSGSDTAVRGGSPQSAFDCGVVGSNSSSPNISHACAVPLVDAFVGGAKSYGIGPANGVSVYVEIAAKASGTTQLWAPIG